MTLPDDIVTEAERLTRLAREADQREDSAAPTGLGLLTGGADDREAVDADEGEAHREARDELLAEHDYVARIRSDDTGDVLVLHPAEWLGEEDTVQVEHIDDVDRGVEVPLEGTGDGADWDEVEAHNRAAARAVAEEHGPVHAENARTFVDFMSNHYAKRVEKATPAEVEEFLTEYFPRNAWPSEEQKAVVEETVELVREAGASATC